jgi:Asp-tRNA(Asn)/Glu-tRNA(Gln) amidotransferase A subunit family amidase
VLSVQTQPFEALGKTIPELQEAMEQGDVTSAELVRQYLARIDAFDRRGPRLNSMIYVNPDAIADAEALDRERRESGPRGPLHGIPVILKDNYDTADMPTTAGSVALARHVPSDDGYQVQKLREAGAVFIGKANMHELAFGITTVSSLGGQTRNPYDPSRVPGGSSGGTAAAIAAEFAAIGMGSDTCGSIRIPAANNNLFGLRVTQGLSSRAGIVPLALTQDVGGPIARSVVDLAIVLDATVGLDPRDPQTAMSAGHVPETYTAFLREDGLDGVRLGMLSAFLVDEGQTAAVTRVVRRAAELMAEHGAELVELDTDVDELEGALGGASVIRMEMKFDLRDYLEGARELPVRSLDDILSTGLYHEVLTERLRSANEAVEDSEAYTERLAQRPEIRRRLLGIMEANDLDAIVYPTLRHPPARIGDSQPGSSCAPAAHSGLPAFSLPAGFTEDGLPVGIELLGKSFSEGELIAMAYAYEQEASPRRLPARTPSLVSGSLSRAFRVDHEAVRGRLRLDRPTQTLHYDLAFPGLVAGELIDIKLARSATGPIVDSFGIDSSGAMPIANDDLQPLVDGNAELWLFTISDPALPVRASITPAR